jgi:large subunit ribosomal protein L35
LKFPEGKEDAEDQESPWRGEALQEDGHGQVPPLKAFKRHILTSKAKTRKRHMRGTFVVDAADAGKLKRMLPYD